MAENPVEIPQQMRNLAEQNIKQAHAAYEQLTDFVTKAVGTWMGAMPASPMATGSRMYKTVLRKPRRRMMKHSVLQSVKIRRRHIGNTSIIHGHDMLARRKSAWVF